MKFCGQLMRRLLRWFSAQRNSAAIARIVIGVFNYLGEVDSLSFPWKLVPKGFSSPLVLSLFSTSISSSLLIQVTSSAAFRTTRYACTSETTLSGAASCCLVDTEVSGMDAFGGRFVSTIAPLLAQCEMALRYTTFRQSIVWQLKRLRFGPLSLARPQGWPLVTCSRIHYKALPFELIFFSSVRSH
jgi:hypothetical protein